MNNPYALFALINMTATVWSVAVGAPFVLVVVGLVLTCLSLAMWQATKGD